ncbi:MAG: nucleotidyl transferase AbiEii/AbiGii toxin family protein [Coriobacteriales bacterium]|nr:nucleotidyl transferase AbiEii/AbiGii toxin family protein [Coriobacteriales bacterium]
MYLHEDSDLLRELVAATTAALGISQDYVYKDYFICAALKGIAALYPEMTFKGGTALSKCYGAIARFSEDVDLGLDATHPSEGMRKKTKTAIRSAISALGLIIENIGDTKSRREFNQYIVMLPPLIDSVAASRLLIEVSLMSATTPSQTGELISFIGQYLKDLGRSDLLSRYDLDNFSIKVVSLERAFVDKSFAVADYYLNRSVSQRQSRHIYDLYKLAALISFDDTLATLFSQARSERQSNSHCLSAAPDVSLADTLRKLHVQEAYRYDYEQITTPLLYENIDYCTAATVLPEIANFLDGQFGRTLAS